jgi:hypothetical protein
MKMQISYVVLAGILILSLQGCRNDMKSNRKNCPLVLPPVKVNVFDSTNKAITGANVQVINVSKSTSITLEESTDQAGHFDGFEVHTGAAEYQVKISKAGYRDATINNIIVTSTGSPCYYPKTQEINVILSP